MKQINNKNIYIIIIISFLLCCISNENNCGLFVKKIECKKTKVVLNKPSAVVTKLSSKKVIQSHLRRWNCEKYQDILCRRIEIGDENEVWGLYENNLIVRFSNEFIEEIELKLDGYIIDFTYIKPNAFYVIYENNNSWYGGLLDVQNQALENISLLNNARNIKWSEKNNELYFIDFNKVLRKITMEDKRLFFLDDEVLDSFVNNKHLLYAKNKEFITVELSSGISQKYVYDRRIDIIHGVSTKGSCYVEKKISDTKSLDINEKSGLYLINRKGNFRIINACIQKVDISNNNLAIVSKEGEKEFLNLYLTNE